MSLNKKTIALGADHAGFEYKNWIKQKLESEGYDVMDMGTHSEDSVDYPDFIHPVAESVENKKANQGVIICGSGNGVAMTANKHQGIRAAIAWNDDLAALARQHNDANVLAIPARFVSKELALSMVDIFLNTSFEGGRHQRRVDKIASC
jgi:ribose 5-phosphate isomerase B